MIDPIEPPRRKNPLLRTRLPASPPRARSRGSHGFTRAAAEGRFVAILDVLVRKGCRRAGIHELHRHVAVARVDQHALRLWHENRLAIRPSRVYVDQVPRSDQFFPC